LRSVQPYLTAGAGSFIADTVGDTRYLGGMSLTDHTRAADFSTNVGAGLVYRVTDWLGVNADYRTFFLHRDGSDPRVHRLTTGLTFAIR
jgi:hypothetical protein